MDPGSGGIHLLNSLHKFISLTNLPSSLAEGSEQSLSVSQLKVVTNFLRLNLLSPLRKLEPTAILTDVVDPRSRPSIDVLAQWWMTLLNFLHSNLISEVKHVTLAMDLISVSLEAISRIVALSVPTLHGFDARVREIHSYHLLLTVRWITNRLVLNSRKRSDLLNPANTPNNQSNIPIIFQYLKRYTALLTPLIGKIIAYSYCYLEDELHYDVEVVKFLSKGRFDIQDIGSKSLVPWRSKSFALLNSDSSQSKYTLELLEEFKHSVSKDQITDEVKRVFPIMISYLQNPQVLSAFTFHYWFIVMTTHHELGLDSLDLMNFPGGSIVMQLCSVSLSGDLEKLTKYIKAQDKQDKQEAALLKTTPNSNPNQVKVSREKILDFIFTKFRCTKLIECNVSLLGLLDSTPISQKLLKDFCHQQDTQFLRTSSVIPAYDSWMANIIFNVIMQFATFRFDILPAYAEEISWGRWIEGLLGTLRTFNGDSQLVGLTCLFNLWHSIPLSLRVTIVESFVNELWDLLSTDTDFQVVSILFHKVVIFKVISDRELPGATLETIKKKLFSLNLETLHWIELLDCDYTQLVDEKAVLTFPANNRFVLERQSPLYEEDLLILNNSKQADTDRRTATNTPLFTNMSKLRNVRPDFVTSGGKYPFDVSDELVGRAALMLAQKNKTRRESELSKALISSEASSLHSEESNDSMAREKNNGSKFGFGALLSTFTKTKPELPPKPSMTNQKRNSFASNNSSKTFETQELMSMHSTVSSIPSNSSQSESSDDLLYKLAHKSRSQILNNNAADPVKKRKLLAPPESKYNKQIIMREPIKFVFKTAAVTSQTTQKRNMLDKIHDYNKKWGVKSNDPYNKPLPIPVGIPSDTLLDGFDFDSLQPTIEELQQLNLVEESINNVYNEDFGRRDAEKTIPQIDISQVFPDSTAMDLENLLRDTKNAMKSSNLTNSVDRMRNITRLRKLIRSIYTFNLTLQEYIEFEKANPNEYIFIEFDPGLHQNHSLNKGLQSMTSYY